MVRRTALLTDQAFDITSSSRPSYGGMNLAFLGAMEQILHASRAVTGLMAVAMSAFFLASSVPSYCPLLLEPDFVLGIVA